jgi:tRNA(Ile)-lysidine synthase
LSFLSEAGIPHRIDTSNQSRKYQRNRIRLDVLPAWNRINPGIVPGLARLGEQVWAQQQFLMMQAERVVARATLQSGPGSLTLDARRLLRYDSALDPHVLRVLVERIGLGIVPSPSTVARFAELRALRGGNATVEQGDFVITRSQLSIRVGARRNTKRRRSPSLQTRVIDMSGLSEWNDKLVACFDLDSVDGDLKVRWPRPGDRYQPIGLHGTKKLADLFADRKVPSFERLQVPVVVDQQGILWPVGHPIAQRARLTNRTRRVLEARLKEGSWKSRS